MKHKVLVAMSGGLDSSVAAYLLASKGYDVSGVTMCLGFGRRGSQKERRAGSVDIEDARRVCRMLGIKHHIVDLGDMFERRVINYFAAEYAAGRTPNPCVQCNRHLKFGALVKLSVRMGFDFLATGHYAAIGSYKGQIVIRKPRDLRKDQTYFLYGIPQDALPRIMFPLGCLTRDQAGRIASAAGLSVAEKPQSQDICFVPDGDYASFLLLRGHDASPGDIVDEDGRVIGRHPGTIHYTIGQRSGLGISSAYPLYVRAIDAAHNRLVVCARQGLRADGLVACKVNLHVKDFPRRAMVKIRYGHAAVAAQVTLRKGRLRVMFASPQESVTPGQSAVLYDRDALLGGGLIERVIRREHGR
ncbi:MAG TPA: tRNA 2-thiouridine(34) synthase MnmA [Candidatus Omnitrophota bacterium]|nr:tRNA 2-thiouridine(34) synthase MnmA [Candidatus Omnitrophota bacterium]